MVEKCSNLLSEIKSNSSHRSTSQWPEEDLNDTVTSVNQNFAGWTGFLKDFFKNALLEILGNGA